MQQSDEPIAISAIQHYSFCPRECALIHIDQTFEDNLYTLRGHAVHERVDKPDTDLQKGVRIERALPLYSYKLGLTGKADVVEFLVDGTPYPVEYKHGPKRIKQHDDLQLAAQAMCLEEMTGHAVPYGAIYHYSSRRRREVEINRELREEVIMIVAQIKAMMQAKFLPTPVNDDRCRNCSLIDMCQPHAIANISMQKQLKTELFNMVDS